MPPILTLSLDFELLWGVFDKVGTAYNPQYFSNTRKTIPKMLELFANNQIEVTWATVGMLFAENQEEWEAYSPNFLPTYKEKKYSAYHYAKINGIRPEVHFAPELIREIIQTPFQELGSHTFAHYYTLMRGQGPDQFRDDLKASQGIAKSKFGIELKSLVFPRNHVNEHYLGICKEEGFEFVRGNPENWFWQETQHEGMSKKWLRSIDCYFPSGKKTSYTAKEVVKSPNKPLLMPSSRIFRPHSTTLGILNSMRLNTILNEMETAAKAGEIYHLWSHPHNFGNHPEASLLELKKIIQQFVRLRDTYEMTSLCMGNLGNQIKNG